ncbi:MAG: hypothetical protein RMX97_02655 [Nostoc sp. DedQUE11]|nr:hypothetical protein [Nostoc sp. DedQUE11]
MPNWNGVAIPEPSQIKIPNSIPQNFNWNSYLADPKGTFNKFKGARETHRMNWKGYRTAAASTKKVILSSPSKKIINAAMQQVRTLRRGKKIADEAKKVADATKKVQETMLGKVAGGDIQSKAAKISALLGVLSIIGVFALLKLSDFVTDRTFEDLSLLNSEISKINKLAVDIGAQVKGTQKSIIGINQELTRNAQEYSRLNKQADKIGQEVTAAKKQANDALYETREGRKIVTGLAEAARKIGNDALYEARQNKIAIEAKITEQRLNFDAKIQSINAQISKFNNSVSDAFQKSVNATISKLQSDLAATKAQVSAIKPQKPQDVDTNSITANAIAAAKSLVTPLQSQVNNLNNTVNGLQSQTTQIPVLANSISNLGKTINAVDNKADAAMNEARNKGVPNLAPIQQQLDEKFNRFVADNNKALGIQDLEISNLGKEFDKKLADFNRLNNLSSEQRFQEFKKDNDKALGTLGLEQSKLSQEFDQRFADFKRQSEMTSDQRFEEFERENKQSLGLLKSDVQQINKDVNTTKSDITKIDTRLKDQEKVNSAALPKLDEIINRLPFIPALTAAAIRPDIPTIPQIENAAATGTCRTTQPGGCMRRALDDSIANINQNTNNRINALDVVNTGANGALLMGQQTILTRLGDQLPGGIGGKLTRFSQWLQLDRALNLLIFAATVHNAFQLTNDIGMTLGSAFSNILQVIGIKDDSGNAVDVGQIINSTVENLVKAIVGEQNYTTISTAWAKANRIYQSTTNAINSFTNIGHTILDGLENLGSMEGKIGNALRAWGAVGEKAYEWFNPNPNYHSRILRFFQNSQQGASTILQVTQVPIDVTEALTEFSESTTEMVKAIKEDPNTTNGIGTPEAAQVKEQRETAKAASLGSLISVTDIFNANQ